MPEDGDAQTYFRDLCEPDLVERYGDRADDPIVRQRLDYELGVIHKMGFDTYFLIVWDLCRYAREHGYLVQRPRLCGWLDRGLHSGYHPGRSHRARA